MKKNKIVLIGAGAVGQAFIYAAISKNLAAEYVMIDLNEEVVKGNALDFEDAAPISNMNFSIKFGDYKDIADADILVITAGRPQKPGETRLEMMADNSKIMKSIANLVKDSGFNGITLVASNPVDIMTYVYQKVTGFMPNKVISSGTLLDTSRLKVELSKLFQVDYKDIDANIIAEHGDSGVAVLSSAKIKGENLLEYAEKMNISIEDINKACKNALMKAYEIIKRKGSTYWGIGSSLAVITEAILNNTGLIAPVSKLLTGEYGHDNVYASILSEISPTGTGKSIEISLSDEENAKFDKSIEILKESIKTAVEAIK